MSEVHPENTEKLKWRSPTLEKQSPTLETLSIYFWPSKRLLKAREARKALGDEIAFRMVHFVFTIRAFKANNSSYYKLDIEIHRMSCKYAS